MKKILLYCHDTLGFGHISRMLNIYEVLKNSHEIKMVFGGNVPKEFIDSSIHIILPVVNELTIHTPSKEEQKIIETRKKIIQESIQKFEPDLLLMDYFPFGRVSLQGEIDFLISETKKKESAKAYTFMRDILSGKVSSFSREEYFNLEQGITDFFGYPFTYLIEKYQKDFGEFFQDYSYGYKIFSEFLYQPELLSEDTFLHLLQEYYFVTGTIDGCLVFGDKEKYSLESEFQFSDKVNNNFHYLGYLPPKYPSTDHIEKVGDFILISVGGSLFSKELYTNLLDTLLLQKKYNIKCMLPFFNSDEISDIIKKYQSFSQIEFLPFGVNYKELRKQAFACVTGGGYGAFMDIISYSIPTLILLNYNETVAINQTEQYQRLVTFQGEYPVLLYEEGVTIEIIMDFFLGTQEQRNIITSDINISGAENLRSLIQKV